MSRMYDLIEVLKPKNNLNNEQVNECLHKLDMFRFDSNNVLNSFSRIIGAATNGGDFNPGEEVFRDVGILLSMLSELNTLCEESEHYYRGKLEDKAVKLEEVS